MSNGIPGWYLHISIPLLYLKTLAGSLVFRYPLRGRQNVGVRFLLCMMGSLGIAFAIQQYGIPFFRVLSWQYMAVAVYILVAATMWCCWDVSPWTATLLASSGYVAQHIGNSVEAILCLVPFVERGIKDSIGILFLDILCYGGTFAVLFLAVYPMISKNAFDLDHRLKILFSLMMLLLCFGMSRLTKGAFGQQTMNLTDHLYSIVSGSLILFLQFSVAEKVKLRKDVNTMREVVHQQQVQYERSKENVQLIHAQYHDLRQILQTLQGRITAQELERFDQTMLGCDASIQTGSDVLDVLLTEKRMLFEKQGVHITCFVDGAALHFMDEIDLYALFSNALTNAIAAVTELPDKEARFINLTMSRTDHMVVIHMENPFSGELQFENGLPQSRRDRRYHGFGMKSMERIAEKYGGSLTIGQADGLFSLDIILFPAERQNTKEID